MNRADVHLGHTGELWLPLAAALEDPVRGTRWVGPAFALHAPGGEPVNSAATSLSLFEGERNLSFGERATYIVAGLGMAAAGAKPRPNLLLNVLALAGGAMLAWSGYVGRCPVKAALTSGHHSGTPRRLGR